MILEKKEDKKVLHYFEKISEIPRGSKNNKAISDYLVDFAKEQKLEWYQDEAWNVIIKKKASPGYEKVPAVIIQGHMDMVCEKNSDTEHDFLAEGLKLCREGDYIYAEGTTLGGDDGIALAYGLALLTEENLVHPPLEMVFTTDEEIGMDGAAALDTGKLSGQYMINIDSEEEGKILLGCAGGMTSVLKLPLERKEETGIRVEIKITGLAGGHSGTDITKNRTNSTLLLGRLLFELSMEVPFMGILLKGGVKDNVIPRESYGEILVKKGTVSVLLEGLSDLYQVYKSELAVSEPGFAIKVTSENIEETCSVLTEESMEKVLDLLLFTPNGVQVMSSDIKETPESSLNLGIFQMSESEALLSYSVRSSVSTYKEFMGHKLEALITRLGGAYSVHGKYPAWELRTESKLANICMNVYEKQYGKKPETEVIHAGLECGIFSDKMKELDIVSIGPEIVDIHTPNEKMSISSVIRVYHYVIEILKEICK